MTSLFIFWGSLIFIFYTYLGYPLYLYVLFWLFPKPVGKEVVEPFLFISVVIAAKNEEINIEKRINNLLQQNYPSDKLEIIVISDGSTDETVPIVQGLVNKQYPGKVAITCHAYSSSLGKPTALNLGVQNASGEIIVFTDARQRFEKNAILELSKNFSDPTIGGASGELIFLEEGDSSIKVQMGVYWKYEKKIRKMESESGSVVGVTGAIYAIRKHLYRPLPAVTLVDDVLTPMNIVMQGYRVIFDSQAIAFDTVSEDVKKEWHRKVRTLAGNWQLLNLYPSLLNPLKNQLFFRFLSHKLDRLLVPLLLPLLLFCSAIQSGIFFQTITLLQMAFYSVALVAYMIPAVQKIFFVKIIYFFCALNLAALKGFWVWCTGRCCDAWK